MQYLHDPFLIITYVELVQLVFSEGMQANTSTLVGYLV